MPQYTTANTAEKHTRLVNRLKKNPEDITLSSQQVDMIHMIMGVCGEAGELLDAIKKHVIYNKPLDIENILEELGDIEFYLEGLRITLTYNKGAAVDREKILRRNIEKLEKRYGEGKYSDAQANKRADKLEEERKEDSYTSGLPFAGTWDDPIEEKPKNNTTNEILLVTRIEDGGSTVVVTQSQYEALKEKGALCKDVTYKILPDEFSKEEEEDRF